MAVKAKIAMVTKMIARTVARKSWLDATTPSISCGLFPFKSRRNSCSSCTVALEFALSSRKSALVLAMELRDALDDSALPFIGSKFVRVQGCERGRLRLH